MTAGGLERPRPGAATGLGEPWQGQGSVSDKSRLTLYPLENSLLICVELVLVFRILSRLTDEPGVVSSLL